jgi:hypothetical protein
MKTLTMDSRAEISSVVFKAVRESAFCDRFGVVVALCALSEVAWLISWCRGTDVASLSGSSWRFNLKYIGLSRSYNRGEAV